MAEEARQRRQLRRVGHRRSVIHKVAVTVDQEAELVQRAEAQGWTVNRLLVESALSGGADVAGAKAALAGELFAISRLLGAVSRNVNQLTKATHATGEVQPGTEPALAALTRLLGRLEEVLAR